MGFPSWVTFVYISTNGNFISTTDRSPDVELKLADIPMLAPEDAVRH